MNFSYVGGAADILALNKGNEKRKKGKREIEEERLIINQLPR